MKKYGILFLLACFAFTVGNCQTKAQKDSLMKVMADEACTEIKNKDFSNLKDEDLEMELGMAVIPVFTRHAESIHTIFGVDISNQAEITEFGQSLGVKLAITCPEFMGMVTKSNAFKDAAKIRSGGPAPLKYSLSGVFTKFVPGEISYFLIKDATGRTEKIWWMGYFNGAEYFTDPKNINKNITVKYTEMEVYNAAIKTYIKIKVAAGIDK